MRERHEAGYPRNAWYALASSSEITREPLGTRALDLPVVLFRTRTARSSRWVTATHTARTR